MKEFHGFHLKIIFGLLCLITYTIANFVHPLEASESTLITETKGYDYSQFKLSDANFKTINEPAAELGRLLFYDPILSGNRNISCGTCHHHNMASTDAVSLGVGQGGSGIGPDRKAVDGIHRIKRRMPRNAPHLFNLGADQIKILMWDGRISEDPIFGNGFNTPAEEFLPHGLNSVLAAQSLFPLVGEVEMGGSPIQNDVASAVNSRIDYGWPLLVARLRSVPGYEPLFIAAFDDVQSIQNVTIVHVANAIGEFVASEWRSFDSPFDKWLNGQSELSQSQLSGMELFLGKGNCILCHSGPLFTDNDFHALAIPPFGPGRIRRFQLQNRDVGRMGESDDLDDAYRFRTPSLRNVELTGPYGHNGAFADLKSIIKHHLNPIKSLESWEPNQAILADVPWINHMDFQIWDNRLEMNRFKSAVDIQPISLTESEISDIESFLKSLTGEQSVNGRLGRPDTVPSGLPVD